MDTFTISQLAQFAGIKPHTIRIWEQRYEALRPFRSEGNTRYYDNTQLRRLLNITSLSALGYKVSELCTMKDDQLFRLINEVQGNNHITKRQEYYISRLIAAAMNYDEAAFEKIFGHCLLQFSMKEFYRHLLYPMLDRMGMMWAGNEIPPANEHFISNLLRQKLFTAIDGLDAPSRSEKKWICFLPENEFHELGLLFATYMIRSKGFHAIYMGSNVPLESLITAAKDINPTHAITFLVSHNSAENNQAYINTLSDSLRKQKILIAANEKILSSLKRKNKCSVG